jgi:two-component system OmpR family response regulator
LLPERVLPARKSDLMRVLLVEDEPGLAAMVTRGLRAEGFVVVEADNGPDGLARASDERFDVIVLDIMLPGFSGYQVLRRLRARQVWTPVLMLTAKDGEYEETDAFDLGADDYVTKPVRFRVLLARVRALVRRGAPMPPAVLTAGNLTVDPANREVTRAGTPISLSPREFSVLELLMRKKDTVVTKKEIIDHVWEANFDGPANIVEVYIRYIRRKIDSPFGTNTIETLRGAGYRLLP